MIVSSSARWVLHNAYKGNLTLPEGIAKDHGNEETWRRDQKVKVWGTWIIKYKVIQGTGVIKTGIFAEDVC